MKKYPKDTEWEPVTEMLFVVEAVASTCCGVLEIGEIREGKFGRIYQDGQSGDYYDGTLKHHNRALTYASVKAEFKKFLEEKKERYGIVVCYLLSTQQKGDFGRLLRECGFTDHGSFFNPKTGNTLHHWSYTLRKQKPRKKKSSKSILTR